MLRLIVALLWFVGCVVEAKTTCAQQEPLLCVSASQVDRLVTLVVENKTSYPATVELELLRLKNVRVDNIKPLISTYEPGTQALAVKLAVVDESKTMGWGYKFYWQRGKLGVKHDDAQVYQLPFAPGKAYKLTQGFNGQFSHSGADQYGLDFAMPVGTKVYAARRGTVVAVRESSQTGGFRPSFRHAANFVAVLHDDGSLGEYFHLQYQGVVVNEGDKVLAGQWLGYSGNTGYSSAPHLHFSVHSVLSAKKRRSHPIRFNTSDGISLLQTGLFYQLNN